MKGTKTLFPIWLLGARLGRTHATVNRELSIMRTAFHKARKRTPPKVTVVPYFPMVKETTVRTGFLTDQQYSDLLDTLAPNQKLSTFQPM
jgi:hypothetical protein